VKGLFINPPGNIWTGFHTTFEGENKVFQKTKIPFYLSQEPSVDGIVKAEVYDNKNRLINTVETTALSKGLNYMIWKLDEKSSSFEGAWSDDFSRDIPVLPGDYQIILKYGSFKDTTIVKVIPDPRFELDPKVNQELYAFRKQVDAQVALLAQQLKEIDQKKKTVAKLEEQLKEKQTGSDKKLGKRFNEMKQALSTLRAQGQIPKPERQVGAWQSFETAPYSKIQEVLNIAAAQTTVPSQQNRQVLKQATALINEFSKAVTNFMNTEWISFELIIKKHNLNLAVE
jgi:hypothetical protein